MAKRAIALSEFILSLLLVLASIVSLSSAGLPNFIRGRPKGGLLGSPPTTGDAELPPEQWFQQRLTHFDDADLRTWSQRYFTNTTNFKADGPVFLMIGGEGTANPVWLTTGSMMANAEKYGAICFLLEHRFYGKSHPLQDLSDSSLQFLNSEQALADLAAFQTAMTIKYNLTGKNKWVAFGGSYPGSLAAWYRLKYPHLVHGSVATSAPIYAELDFTAYLEVVSASLATAGPSCVDNISAATKTIAELITTEEGLSNLSSIFKLCKPLSIEQKDDIVQFSSQLAGNFMGVVQYNKDNRKFEGAVGTDVTIDVLCRKMTDDAVPDNLQRYANVNALLLETYSSSCLDSSYADSIASLRNTSLSSSASEGGRQWMYQTCTEFGFFQTSDSSKQPFGDLFPASFSIQQCRDIFGAQFNATNIERGILRTNTNYGGYGITSSKIAFPNGSIDPWHALGIISDITPSLVAIFIEGTAHCANMYPATRNDSVALVKARDMVQSLVGQWLNEP